jgi:exonuclease III
VTRKAYSSSQKSNKETSELNDTINKIGFIDIYRIFHPINTEYTFFLTAHGTFFKIDHILVHKGSLNKYKKN